MDRSGGDSGGTDLGQEPDPDQPGVAESQPVRQRRALRWTSLSQAAIMYYRRERAQQVEKNLSFFGRLLEPILERHDPAPTLIRVLARLVVHAFALYLTILILDGIATGAMLLRSKVIGEQPPEIYFLPMHHVGYIIPAAMSVLLGGEILELLRVAFNDLLHFVGSVLEMFSDDDDKSD